MKGQPTGIKILAVLTIIFGVILFFIFGLFFVLGAVGGPYSSQPQQGLPIVFYIPLILSFVAFLLSIGMLRRVRWAWHISLVFWIIIFLFFIWTYTFINAWRWMFYLESGGWYMFLSIMRILFLPSPFICAVGCLIYLLTKTPREYFYTKR